MLVGKLLDVAGTLRFLASTRVNGVQVLEAGPRLRDGDVDTHFQPVVQKLTEEAAQPARPIHYVATDASLSDLADALRGEAVVGLDVETTLRSPSLCTVQLANAHDNWVIDYLAVSSLEPLRELFEGSTTLVIHYAHFERRILAKVGFTLQGVVDTWQLSKQKHGKDALGGHSLAMVAERELGKVIGKEQQTSDWARRPLSLNQVRYAALDAELMIDLHRVFLT